MIDQRIGRHGRNKPLRPGVTAKKAGDEKCAGDQGEMFVRQIGESMWASIVVSGLQIVTGHAAFFSLSRYAGRGLG